MKRKIRTYGELSEICSSLSRIVHSGTGTADGLAILAEGFEDRELKHVFEEMTEKADRGQPLSKLFAESGCFPEYAERLLAVGERTGHVEDALTALASYYDAQASLSRQFKSAVLYPALLFTVMISIFVILLCDVLPIFNDVYVQLGSGLSGFAGWLYRIGCALKTVTPLLLALLAAAVALLIAFALSQSFRDKILGVFVRGSGKTGELLEAARFSQALDMGISSGMAAEAAVSGAGKLLADANAEKKCGSCAEMLMEGKTLPEALAASHLLPAGEVRLLNIARRTGSEKDAVRLMAKDLGDKYLDASRDRLGRIEPAMVITGCVLLGIIIISVMLPLLKVTLAIG